eukprot:TRINITY_DN5378_c0_g1_i2.p1 TRINITY_DN5378_c0_g1~~TRINITY_DN5378_c0_g1_i2.p1  ORF type:complete len:373 (+),score=125.99 TRINITY_DN5378_c0_g1_i2:52-1170(+)
MEFMPPLEWCLVAVLLLVLRVYAILPKAGRAAPAPLPKVRLLAVLGSGGHTTEMFYDLATLKDTKRFDRHYVIAATDSGSRAKAAAFEGTLGGALSESRVHVVPRAREVGQSYVSSVYTTLVASVTSFKHVFLLRPDIVVCNGPGTCVPICVAAYALRFFAVKHVAVVYSESLACVAHLSLSGKILWRFADRFTVQWGMLKDLLGARALYAGRCTYDLPALGPAASGGDGSCVVTVGSTKFDKLIEAVDSEAVLDALRRKGIKKIIVQKGNGAYAPTVLPQAADVEVFEYSKEVPAMLKKASYVISHAGAGTVYDCLLHDRRLLIVPNETLMANHQVQLAEELEKYSLVQWCRPDNLLKELGVCAHIRTAVG